ncbi:hypothetical protein JZ751_018336 [Albula glossodonta]|uniref:Uncharacterized protein n=1 Tax=Albula glossodonta TaxID=121402 RepID=A0A8T2NX56_9TELE|nr:hypothetical protein JZ751_018336 [Albula glossodonta]
MGWFSRFVRYKNLALELELIPCVDVVTVPVRVADEMEYDERLARFRQGHVNPFDRGEEDGTREDKDVPPHGEW